ncbi:MAG: hypothetical protein ACKKL5_03605 [Candidatus Komeilibacteria bacterium]
MVKEKNVKQYLEDDETAAKLDILSYKYNIPARAVASAILSGELPHDLVTGFLEEELKLEAEQAKELWISIQEVIIAPWQDWQPVKTTIAAPEDNSGSIHFHKDSWREFLKPDNLLAAQAELQRVSSGQIAKIVDYLWQSLGLEKKQEVITILVYLAKKGQLLKLWQDHRLAGILRKYLIVDKQFGEAQVEKWLNSPWTAGMLSLALRQILQSKLGFDNSEAAQISLSIIDQLGPADKARFILIAYVDTKDNKLYWSEVEPDDSGLLLAV